MIVFITLMIFGCVGFAIPKQYLKGYMLISAICISSLYFFFTPPIYYDLSRHYDLLHIIRRLDIKTVLFGREESFNRMLNEYMDNSKIYLIYAYIISQFGVDALLPVITGIIIFSAVSKIIIMTAEDIGGKIEDWKIAFCFFFLLMMMDFRTISGIRNMLAFALFAYVLYYDLVRNVGKIRCFIAYFIIANIHTSVYILIVIRLFLSIEKLLPKWIIMLVILLLYSFLDIIVRLLNMIIDVPLVQSLLRKINTYGYGGGSDYRYTRGVIHLILILIQMFVYLYVKRNLYLQKKFIRYGDFFFFSILLALGAIRQYDMFVRSNMLFYFTIYPFLLLFLKNNVDELPHELITSKNSLIGLSEVCVYFMIFAAVIISIIMYVNGYYAPMDSGFHLSV